jgi:GTP-binding protein
MLISDLGYSDYLGKLAIGRIVNGIYTGQTLVKCIGENNESTIFKPKKCQMYTGLSLSDVITAEPGDIIIVSGLETIKIGDTVCSPECTQALERITVDEPTLSMEFTINTSPLCGTEGLYVQSGKIRDRLFKEALHNVAIKVEETTDRDRFIVKGRGEFQMVIILETMRREGFELSVGRPEVIYKRVNNKLLEPIEHAFVDCQEEYLGIVTEKLCQRKGRITNLINNGFGRVRAEFSVPSRALIGYRDEFLTDTRGTGILNTLFDSYDEYRGDFPTRFKGSIVADRPGQAVAYSLFNIEPRGILFIAPGETVYEGMIIGEYNKEGDINVNAVKKKKLTNMRASGKDENTICTPVKPMTLERAINFINDDEMVEVTPLSIRLHKRELSAVRRHQVRSRQNKAKKLTG